jgi:hypothetical protein
VPYSASPNAAVAISRHQMNLRIGVVASDRRARRGRRDAALM